MGVDRVPTLRTVRLHLSPLLGSDATAVFRYASNPRVARYMTWSVHESVKDSKAFLERIAEVPATEYNWGVRLDPTAEIIGAVEFSFRTPSEAEIHYAFDEPYWGRGIATEACRAVLSWAFSRFPELARVLSSAVTENRASTRVMEKLGMEREGEYTEYWPKDQVTHHMSVYAVSIARWEEKRAERAT